MSLIQRMVELVGIADQTMSQFVILRITKLTAGYCVEQVN
jgi:hypothetical protein